MKELNLNSFRVLTEEEMKSLEGGSEAYSCSCNGQYAGDADSPEACIKLCGW